MEVGALPEVGLSELAATSQEAGRSTLVALDGVEDPQNLGAIARVIEASGAGGLILTRRHAPPLTAAVSRASAGAIEWLPVARVPNLARALAELQGEGYWTLGADPNGSVSLFDGLPDLGAAPLVVVMGAEGRGMREGVLKRVDHPIRIPLGGGWPR